MLSKAGAKVSHNRTGCAGFGRQAIQEPFQCVLSAG
jgi:hypothetical protein